MSQVQSQEQVLKLTKGLLYCRDYKEAENPIIMIFFLLQKNSTFFFLFVEINVQLIQH